MHRTFLSISSHRETTEGVSASAESSTDVAVATRIASSKSSSATRQPSSTSGRDLRTLAWPRLSSCASPASSLAMEAADAVRGGSG